VVGMAEVVGISRVPTAFSKNKHENKPLTMGSGDQTIELQSDLFQSALSRLEEASKLHQDGYQIVAGSDSQGTYSYFNNRRSFRRVNPFFGVLHLTVDSETPHHNQTMNTKILLIAIVTLSAFLGSCATSHNSGQATACPDCTTVLVENQYVDDLTVEPEFYKRHSCPGCQGALATFFKEAKLQHRCSICSTKGFSCPINHPIKKS